MIDHLKQDKWFIDVRGEIRGPSSSWDIIQQLIGGHLKVIHRVSRDRQNWKGICNEEYFENAVMTAIDYYSSMAGDASNKEDSGEVDEDTGFSNLGNISAGIQSQLNQAQNLQEMNVGLNSLRKLHADILHNRKTVIEAKPTVQDEIHPEDRNVYVGMETAENKTSFLKNNKFLTAVLVIGFLGLSGLKYLEYKDKMEAQAVTEQIKKMQKEKALEGYDSALSGTEKMRSAELIQLAQDEIAKNNMSFGEKLLERALEVAEVGPDKAKAHSLLGYIATQENNLEKAKQSYEASLKSSQKLYLSYHNFGLLKLKEGKLGEAEALFLKALELKDGPQDRTPTHFALLEAAIQLDQKDNQEAEEKFKLENKDKEKKFTPDYPRMNKAAVFLARSTEAYAREIALAEMYIEYTRDSSKVNRRKLLEFLKIKDADLKEKPSITGQDVSRMKWAHLYSWCLPIYNNDRKSVQLNTLFGYCVFRARGAEAAKPYIDFAVQKAPHDPIYKRYRDLVQKTPNGTKSESTSASMSN